MFTALSTNARQNDLTEQERVHKKKFRARKRQLQGRVRHEIYIEHEKALVCRILARRFAPDSPHRSLLRLLASGAMRRMRRLEGLLYELHGGTVSGLSRGYLLR